ncbi:hypothetical protein PTSG_02830 [Salpingoeca rosetta]|uniref:Uncharacterized protein n=1 Tax=Salpingoeca rosetta (strain ATCC 50818 / BSB-021) TaxID=946362 RepID=F2U3G3_SALR5|nr:uncharacterized protein PTSG_02830 [Salpingoeca rosetta]EGD82157.1 hypothetical protein PTSG_02830 [Salpingoeca rosetta]|eukprot:XP_004996340.1 hypothetical protein PTSG_02830 [Salpingoeca rosetta]
MVEEVFRGRNCPVANSTRCSLSVVARCFNVVSTEGDSSPTSLPTTTTATVVATASTAPSDDEGEQQQQQQQHMGEEEEEEEEERRNNLALLATRASGFGKGAEYRENKPLAVAQTRMHADSRTAATVKTTAQCHDTSFLHSVHGHTSLPFPSSLSSWTATFLRAALAWQ